LNSSPVLKNTRSVFALKVKQRNKRERTNNTNRKERERTNVEEQTKMWKTRKEE
jgi:hypothetical protein